MGVGKENVVSEDMICIYEMNNGEKVFLLFLKIEMDNWQEKFWFLMVDCQIDVCLFIFYNNICYYFGFFYCFFGCKYGFVVILDSVMIIVVGIDGGQFWWCIYGDMVIYIDWCWDNYFYVIWILLGMFNLVVKWIGIEFDQVFLDLLKQLEGVVLGVEFVDIVVVMMVQWIIKSVEEYVFICEGVWIGDVGGVVLVDVVQVGILEYEVVIVLINVMIWEIVKLFLFVELMDIWIWFQFGINMDGVYNFVINKLVEVGDIFSFNCFFMIFGYYIVLECIFFCEYVFDVYFWFWEVNCYVYW